MEHFFINHTVRVLSLIGKNDLDNDAGRQVFGYFLCRSANLISVTK